jgi:hypothetical protein
MNSQSFMTGVTRVINSHHVQTALSASVPAFFVARSAAAAAGMTPNAKAAVWMTFFGFVGTLFREAINSFSEADVAHIQANAPDPITPNAPLYSPDALPSPSPLHQENAVKNFKFPPLPKALTLIAMAAMLSMLCIGCVTAQPAAPGSTASTQPAVAAAPPSIDFAGIEQIAQDAVGAYQVVGPFLPTKDQIVGNVAAAAAQSTLTKIAADRANGLSPSQPDLAALVPLASQLQPLINKGAVAASTATVAPPTPQ